jgi:competence protein ComFC
MNIIKTTKKILDEILKAIFPERKSQKIADQISIEEILLLPKPNSKITKKENVYSFFSYKEKIVQDLIWELKYHRNTTVIEKLAPLFADYIKEDILNKNLFGKESEFVLLAVPISKNKLKTKGFCHIDLLCKEIMKNMKETKVKYLPEALIKIKETKEQNKIKNREERLQNLKDAFWVNKDLVFNKSVILIDDVTTTGATINEIFKALKSAGVKEVEGYTIAN